MFLDVRESHRVPGLPHKRVCGLLPLSPSPATSLCISHHGREPTRLPCLVPTQLFIMTRAPCDYVPGPRRAHGSYRLWPADKSAKGGGVQRPVLPEQPLSWAGAQVCGAGPQPPTCRGCPQMARVGGYRAGLSPGVWLQLKPPLLSPPRPVSLCFCGPWHAPHARGVPRAGK